MHVQPELVMQLFDKCARKDDQTLQHAFEQVMDLPMNCIAASHDHEHVWSEAKVAVKALQLAKLHASRSGRYATCE